MDKKMLRERLKIVLIYWHTQLVIILKYKFTINIVLISALLSARLHFGNDFCQKKPTGYD